MRNDPKTTNRWFSWEKVEEFPPEKIQEPQQASIFSGENENWKGGRTSNKS